MGLRRIGREAALQFLFAMELTPDTATASQETFWQTMRASPAAREFARSLVMGVLNHREQIDQRISALLQKNWQMQRLAVTDKNVLRIAIYELEYCQETPYKVIINEAIEIARKFGSEKSADFINGVLDRVAHQQDSVVS